jgi:putative transposase
VVRQLPDCLREIPGLQPPWQATRLPYKFRADSIAAMAHPPRIPVWLKWDQPVIYFLTFCVTKRQKVLANDEAFAALKEAIDRLTSWKIIAAVLMPDHVHLLLGPVEREAAVGNASGAIKRFVRQQLSAPWQWQPGSFDRLLRSDESAEEKWQYIRENPVRAGLVEKWQDWPYRIGFEL